MASKTQIAFILVLCLVAILAYCPSSQAWPMSAGNPGVSQLARKHLKTPKVPFVQRKKRDLEVLKSVEKIASSVAGTVKDLGRLFG